MINFLKYVFALIVFVFSLPAFSQKLELSVNNEKIINKKFTSKEKLNNYLQSYQNKKIQQGYFASCYDSIFVDSLTNDTKAYISVGKVYRWNEITISDGQKYKNNINKSVVRLSSVDRLFKNIITNYADNGYPFVQVKFDSIVINDEKIDARINIDKGNKILFDSIMIKTEDKIKHYYIEKTLSIKKGDLFSSKKLNNTSKNIKACYFLEEIKSFDVAFNDSLCDLLLYLKKKKASTFSGVLGILPNNTTTGKLLLTGDLQLRLLNVLNYGEDFQLNWQKYQAESQELNINFTFPYIFKTNFGIGAQFSLLKLDSLSLSTDITAKLLYGNSFGTSTYVFYRNVSSFLLVDSIPEDSELNLAKNKSNLFGINFSYSSLDNAFNPRKGILLNIYTANGLKNVSEKSNDENGYSTKSFFSNQSNISISGYIPIARLFCIKLKNQTAIMYCRKIYHNDLYQIGGMNYVRGFDERSIPATNYSVSNIEFRFLFDELSCVYAFYDIGYIESRTISNFKSNYIMGIGVGVDLSTKLGIFSLATAIGKQNEDRFYLKGYKIHIGYKSYF